SSRTAWFRVNRRSSEAINGRGDMGVLKATGIDDSAGVVFEGAGSAVGPGRRLRRDRGMVIGEEPSKKESGRNPRTHAPRDARGMRVPWCQDRSSDRMARA